MLSFYTYDGTKKQNTSWDFFPQLNVPSLTPVSCWLSFDFQSHKHNPKQRQRLAVKPLKTANSLRGKPRPQQHLTAQVSSLLLCLHHFSTSRALWCIKAWNTWATGLPALFYSGCFLHRFLRTFPCARRWEDLFYCLLTFKNTKLAKFYKQVPTVWNKLKCTNDVWWQFAV